MPHPSTTYSERSKVEDEFAEEVKKHKSIPKSHFSDRVGTESSPGYTSGVSQNLVFSILQDLVLCKIELSVIKIYFTYKNTADVLPKTLS